MPKNPIFLNTKIDVLFYFDGELSYARPVELNLAGKSYRLGPVNSWYVTSRGKTSLHHYVLRDVDSEYSFKLCLETDDLTWQLEAMQELHVSKADVLMGSGLVGASV